MKKEGRGPRSRSENAAGVPQTARYPALQATGRVSGHYALWRVALILPPIPLPAHLPSILSPSRFMVTS